MGKIGLKWNNQVIMNGYQDAPLGLLSFLSFAFSVIAAVLAIDMFKLLRTGGFGRTWRLLITASVMLVLLQVLRMAQVLNFRPVAEAHLAQVVELCFIISLAYAFYVQRQLFTHEHKHNEEMEDEEAEDADLNDEDDADSASAEEEYSVSTPSKNWMQGSADISRPAR